MNREQAKQKVEASLALGCHTAAPWVEDREAYIAEKAADLIACIIQPVSATVVAASYPEYSFAEYHESKVWAIAKSGDNWLLTLDGKPDFALGFGSDPASIEMLGFSSADALGEWLG
ncbi:hypothetical protein [Marinimicrobium alkaliphilum]|uniref:hypothetical protein n=1 Tax=Marinimicrobium alkaliphilum TaxID=2202654 RepID=UPI0018E0A4DF|nr:hypothetical protein [Marinimicrobium alkaliphilum]